MSTLWKLITSTAVILGILASCVTLLSVRSAREGLVEAIDQIAPVATALIPFVAVFGTVVAGVVLAMRASGLVKRRIELQRDIESMGPEKRAFYNMAELVENSRHSLTSLRERERPSGFGYDNTVMPQAKAAMDILAKRLNSLGIPTPDQNTIDTFDGRNEWIQFLAPLEVRARAADLEGAIRDAKRFLGVGTT